MLHKEHVEICNDDRRARHRKVGYHDVLGADMNSRWGLDRLSYLSLSSMISVDYTEDIQIVGMLTRSSRNTLKRLMYAHLAKSDEDDKGGS